MFYHDIDDLPVEFRALPEHLVVISEGDFQKARKTRESGEFLLEPDKHFLIMPALDEAQNHPVIQPIVEAGQLKASTILLKNRQINTGDYYLPYEMFAEQNIQTQMLNFSLLCQHLGAKKVKIRLNESAQEILAAGVHVDATVKAATVGMGGDFTAENIANSSTELETDFEGICVKLDDAEALMKTGIFGQNQHIVAFYNSAKNTENRMKSQKAMITIDQNTSRQLDMLIKADIPILETIFSAEIKGKMEKLKSLKVEYEVIF